jgi:hypothetical protein
MPGQPDTGKRIVSIQCHKSHFRRDTNDESPSSAKPKTIKPIRKPTCLSAPWQLIYQIEP